MPDDKFVRYEIHREFRKSKLYLIRDVTDEQKFDGVGINEDEKIYTRELLASGIPEECYQAMTDHIKHAKAEQEFKNHIEVYDLKGDLLETKEHI